MRRSQHSMKDPPEAISIYLIQKRPVTTGITCARMAEYLRRGSEVLTGQINLVIRVGNLVQWGDLHNREKPEIELENS
jgi:hypothetical protein